MSGNNSQKPAFSRQPTAGGKASDRLCGVRSEKKSNTPSNDSEADVEIGFAPALDELREILEHLDRDDVDLDDLSALVRRAAELVKSCRHKLVKTEAQVQEIIGDLAADLEALEAPDKEG